MREPVDVSSLLLLRQMQPPGTPDAVARIVTRFLEETDQRLEALRQACLNGDSKALENAAHALKGIAGTVGATEMSDLSARLEQFGREGRVDGATQLVIDLESALGRARPVFDRLREPA
jgi:HPt (histidine-containing phosphotransfer) domain-containing protein